MMSRLAKAAAAQTGLPVCVEVMEPGGYWSIRLSLPMTAERGRPLVMPLPQQKRSGVISRCSKPHILPVRPKPAWTSSQISTMSCLVHHSRIFFA